MAKAPRKHWKAFFDQAIFPVPVDLPLCPELRPGILRPVLPTSEFDEQEPMLPWELFRRDDALRLLLYSQEIVLDPQDVLHPFLRKAYPSEIRQAELSQIVR